MKKYNYLLSFIMTMFLWSCLDKEPNLDAEGNDELLSLEIDRDLNSQSLDYNEVIYVPIYSDIYVDKLNQTCLLSATLSIRNSSLNDSLFIEKIDYYDTHGNLVRSYLESAIALPPMASVNYVVEREDTRGGNGANFLVSLAAKKKVNPIIQAVMMGEYSNKAFSFLAEGVLIE